MTHSQTFPITSLSVAEKLALCLDGLCRSVAARIAPGIAGWAMQAAMIVLVWGRIRRIEGKIQALLKRYREGRLWGRGAVTAASGRSASTPVARRAGVRRLQLPRSFAWLIQLVPYEAAGFASQLRVVLAEPEIQGLLEASAQARRVLAPLCRMLGIEAEVLTPAPREWLPVASDLKTEPKRERVVPDETSLTSPAVFKTGQHGQPSRIRWGGD